jgi:hypothetical protein
MRVSNFVLALATALIGCLATSSASAQEPDLETGVREHDGFYLRLGIGLGYGFGKAKPEDGPSDAEADVTGIGIPTELAFGGTLAPGLVLGGGSYGFVVPVPKYKNDLSEVDGGQLVASGVGPFVDYYIDPRGGAHVQGALLLSYISNQSKDAQPAGAGFGFGAMLGGGYEVFVSDQWSIGVLARLTYYNVKVKYDTGGDPKSTVSLIVPGILFGATYH